MTLAIDYAADFLVILGEVGEDISYTPKGGSARTIKALIDRTFTEVANQAGNEYPRNTHQVTVAVHATEGIGATEADAGKIDSDTMDYSLDPGDLVTTTFRLVNAKNSGFGRWILLVQA